MFKSFNLFLTGKTTCLFRHDLKMLHSKQANRLSLPMNKIPEKLIPRLVNLIQF